MSDNNSDDIISVLNKLFGAQADAKKAEIQEALAQPLGLRDFRIAPQDVRAARVTNEERHLFDEFIKPYGELLALFQPEACRDSDFLGFNLALTRRMIGSQRLLSPFEVLRGHGVEIVAHSGEAGVSTSFDSHSAVLSFPAEPDALARVTGVLAKYGIVPENMMVSRMGDRDMNLVLEITGESVTREAVQKFMGSLNQKLLLEGDHVVRLYSRPPSRRLERSDAYPARP